MLGLRGVRLSILYPEITRMQVRAIIEAACNLRKRKIDARPEIMIPLAGTVAELRTVHAELKPVAEAVQKEMGVRVPYKFGTMIEIPRAALTAGEIAQEAEFFSFVTNDLTQTTFGFAGYDRARIVWNAIVDRHPALVVRPTSVDDVVSAIQFAHDKDLVVAVRGGAHSVAGFSTCDGGMVIDLSGMRAVAVDPNRKRATAQGGAHLSKLDKSAQAHGLV